MKKINKIIKVSLCLLIVFSFLQCNNKNILSECKSKKIELLLTDILKKKEYFPVAKLILINRDPKQYNDPIDSSMHFAYLYSPKLKIPDKEFYLHWNKDSKPTYPDSVKLKVIDDLTKMEVTAFTVGVYILEVNEDSTKMKINLVYGVGKRADVEGNFTYSFDEKNCKWIVLDSTKTYN